MNKDNAIGLVIGLLAGRAAGGIIALLYAPRSGKESRHLISEKATEVVDIIKEKTEDAVDTVQEAAYEAKRKGNAAVHAIKS